MRLEWPKNNVIPFCPGAMQQRWTLWTVRYDFTSLQWSHLFYLNLIVQQCIQTAGNLCIKKHRGGFGRFQYIFQAANPQAVDPLLIFRTASGSPGLLLAPAGILSPPANSHRLRKRWFSKVVIYHLYPSWFIIITYLNERWQIRKLNLFPTRWLIATLKGGSRCIGQH